MHACTRPCQPGAQVEKQGCWKGESQDLAPRLVSSPRNCNPLGSVSCLSVRKHLPEGPGVWRAG